MSFNKFLILPRQNNLASKFLAMFFNPKIKNRHTIFYKREPWADRVTSKASQDFGGGLGVLPWKKLRPPSADVLKKL